MIWERTLQLTLSSLCILTACGVAASADNWSYHHPNGPNSWPTAFPQCGGQRQSPINVITKQTRYDGSLNDLHVHYANGIALKLSNDGKRISGNVVDHFDANYFTGAGMGSSRFLLEQFHFHLGKSNFRGSEHDIDGRIFPMEMHLVHKEPSSGTAAILAVLFVLQSDENAALKPIINKLQNCSYKGESVLLNSFNVTSLLPKDITKFYSYPGSFTTPPCNETVQWILFEQIVPIAKKQLDAFRNVFENSKQDTKDVHVKLVDNYRPIQPLNNRIVRRNFDHPKFSCGKKSNLTADCRQTIAGRDVFYEVQVDPCSLPVSFNLKIITLGFSFSKVYSADVKTPIPISDLNYGATVEVHFHSDGPKAGQLHITVFQESLPLLTNSTKVLDNLFQVEGVCQRDNCTTDAWDTHWCSSKIGYANDSLLIGFSSVITSPCSSTSMKVKIYRSKFRGQTWVLTAINEFKDKDTYTANLTRSIVAKKQDRDIVRVRRRVAMATQWGVVNLEAHIEKNLHQSLNFMLYLITKSNGGHFLIFDQKYMYSSYVCSKPGGSNIGRKVAIGVSVVMAVVVMIGVTVFIVYRNRKAYFGHRPALVDEIDILDADRL